VFHIVKSYSIKARFHFNDNTSDVKRNSAGHLLRRTEGDDAVGFGGLRERSVQLTKKLAKAHFQKKSMRSWETPAGYCL
jgi:hypothetical protein